MHTRTSRNFAVVAQHGSLREAAEVLHIAQPALSRQIAKMEADLGTALLQRSPTGVRLTQAGEIYLRYAREQLVEEERLRAELRGLKGLHGGVLRIHAIESLAKSLLSPVLAEFQQRHPGAAFNVTVTGSDEIIGAVRDLAADVGLGYFSLPSPGIDIRALRTEPLVALVAADHPLAGKNRITLDMTTPFPLALTNRSSRSRALVDTAFWQAGLRFTTALESNSVELLVDFVQRTNGVTLLLRSSAVHALECGTVSAVAVQSEILNIGAVEALTKTGRKLPAMAESLLQLISDRMGEQQGASATKRLDPASAPWHCQTAVTQI